MSDRLRESVSALMDGEASELELRRLLAGADRQDIREPWRSFHVARGAMTNEDMRFARVDLSERVASVIDAEPGPSRAGLSPWWKSLGGLAVAASVAAVVVVGGKNLQGDSTSQAQVAGVDATGSRVYPAPAAVQARGQVAVSAEYPVSAMPTVLDPDREAERRLQKYLLRHTERAAVNNGQGMISFARVNQLETE